jgi:hypothetical protein
MIKMPLNIARVVELIYALFITLVMVVTIAINICSSAATSVQRWTSIGGGGDERIWRRNWMSY